MNNYMKLEIAAVGENESFARSVVAAFALPLNPSLSELSDIKTAVSEAVTNCVVHAYKRGGVEHKILLECEIESGFPLEKGDLQANGTYGVLHIAITDYGCGIDDVERAIAPFYTTLQNDERSGMGFTIMQTFMDSFSVDSKKGIGTKVVMTKKIGTHENSEIRERVDA